MRDLGGSRLPGFTHSRRDQRLQRWFRVSIELPFLQCPLRLASNFYECLDYSAKVMRVLEIEHIRTTQLSVYGQSAEINFVIRCETEAKTVFFAAAGGDDGDKIEGLVQILMRQFEITKTLPKCSRNSSPLHLCQ
jgi:hypothetical protein